MFRMWLSGEVSSKLPSVAVKQISEKLQRFGETQPSCFQRRIRSLTELGHMKGSEFRTLLLYTGPVALKDILPIDKYKHFLVFHAAILILCDTDICHSKSDLAKILLTAFVDIFKDIYGDHHIVYNVHCLTHLVDDVKLFGALDEWSSFPFENFMFQIKRLLRKNSHVLSELYNRLYEMNLINFSKQNICGKIKYPILKRKYEFKSHTTYKEIHFSNFSLCDKISDQWFLTKTDKHIIKMKHVELDANGKIVICGSKIRSKTDFYQIPVVSSTFNIFASNGELEEHLTYWPVDEVFKKVFYMKNPDDGDFVFFPLLHTKN